jgi:hypothetical protein
MKLSATLRLLTIALTAVFLTTSATSLRAMVFHDSDYHFREKEKDKHKDKDKEYRPVPEGSAAAISILAAVALGGGVLLWRRKGRATVA